MNGYTPPVLPSAGLGSSTPQLNGHRSNSAACLDQNPASASHAKALYEQRKNYMKNSVNSLMETSQYHVEHLTTFVMDLKEAVITVDDGLRKLKLLEAKGKVWTQDMLLQVDDKAVSLIDADTKNELENYPLSSILQCQALMDVCCYDSILALVCKEPGQAKPDLHFFQCDDIKANLIHADIESAISDFRGKMKKRPDTLRMILNSDGVIPPPPSAPAPLAPPTVTQEPVMSRVEAWSTWAANEQSDYEKHRWLLQQEASPEGLAVRVHQDVQVLNHLLDDVEYFVTKLQRAAEAFSELSKKKKSKKSKKKGPGEGVLTLRAKPPSQDEFVDCLQKFKHAFNLLGTLKSYIQNPSAADLVHFLFNPLNMVIQATGGVDLAKSVISPLLTSEAIDFLHTVGTAQERHLWVMLGDGWTKSRLEWPKDHSFAPYVPRFRDGWEPPLATPAQVGHPQGQESLQLNALSSAELQQLEEEAESRLALEHPDTQLLPGADGYALANPAVGHVHVLEKEMAMAAFKQALGHHVDGSYDVHTRSQLRSCARSMYDFVARNNTELSIVKDEIVEVLDDRKQWWRVRNTSGLSGYVPNNILEVTRVMDVSSGRSDPFGHTIQKQRTDYIAKSTLNSIPPAPMPPPLAPVPASLPAPPSEPTPSISPSRVPTPPLPPPAAPPLLDKRDSPVSSSSSSSSDNGSVTMRERQKDRPPYSDRRKSNMEEVQDELVHRLTLGRSAQKKIPPRSASLPTMGLTYESSPDDVKAWLQGKGFSTVTVNSLGVLTGAQLFSLNKDELRTVCPDDGARVYSQVTVQKVALERSSGSELHEVMRRRQEKINAAASDSGVESFDEASGH